MVGGRGRDRTSDPLLAKIVRSKNQQLTPCAMKCYRVLQVQRFRVATSMRRYSVALGRDWWWAQNWAHSAARTRLSVHPIRLVYTLSAPDSSCLNYTQNCTSLPSPGQFIGNQLRWDRSHHSEVFASQNASEIFPCSLHSFNERMITICPPEPAFGQTLPQCFTLYNSSSFPTGSRLMRCTGPGRWY